MSESTTPTQIGKALKALRGTMTQKQAALNAGISHSTWQKIELGLTTRPDPANLKKIADAFDADYQQLLNMVHTPVNFNQITDEEIDRLAARIAPVIAERVARLLGRD